MIQLGLMTCHISIKLSIFHICVFKYEKLLNYLSAIKKFYNKNVKLKMYLLVPTLLFEAMLAYLVYVAANVDWNNHKKLLQAEIVTALQIINTVYFALNIIHIPSVVILGFSMAIYEEFRILHSDLYDAIESRELYNADGTSFSSFKRNFKRICDAVTCLDETFKYYVVISSLCAAGGIFAGIYYQAAGCFKEDVLVITLSSSFLLFLVLCISGDLVRRKVNICNIVDLFALFIESLNSYFNVFPTSDYDSHV